MQVNALCVFDDDTGPALYAGGSFTNAGGVAAPSIAKWDGTQWAGFGGTDCIVNALAVFDDGTGPALYAAGFFTSVDGKPGSLVARWDGTSWSALASGTSGTASALAVFGDG